MRNWVCNVMVENDEVDRGALMRMRGTNGLDGWGNDTQRRLVESGSGRW